MAVDLYLKLDGIIGDVEAKGHTGEISILTLGVDVANKAPLGAAAGKPAFQDIRMTRKTDSASAQLFRHCCSGQHIAHATISVAESPGGTVFLELTLTEVAVTLYELGLSGNAPAETIALNYKSIQIDYKKQDATGAVHSTGTGGWDLTKNALV